MKTETPLGGMYQPILCRNCCCLSSFQKIKEEVNEVLFKAMARSVKAILSYANESLSFFDSCRADKYSVIDSLFMAATKDALLNVVLREICMKILAECFKRESLKKIEISFLMIRD